MDGHSYRKDSSLCLYPSGTLLLLRLNPARNLYRTPYFLLRNQSNTLFTMNLLNFPRYTFLKPLSFVTSSSCCTEASTSNTHSRLRSLLPIENSTYFTCGTEFEYRDKIHWSSCAKTSSRCS
eukprot:NODE_8_length_47770_cov_0.334354.p23 type:complete len:122 gc:universal NODE_8_length_47770_cov_0.334354:14170-13805(-)